MSWLVLWVPRLLRLRWVHASCGCRLPIHRASVCLTRLPPSPLPLASRYGIPSTIVCVAVNASKVLVGAVFFFLPFLLSVGMRMQQLLTRFRVRYVLWELNKCPVPRSNHLFRCLLRYPPPPPPLPFAAKKLNLRFTVWITLPTLGCCWSEAAGVQPVVCKYMRFS